MKIDGPSAWLPSDFPSLDSWSFDLAEDDQLTILDLATEEPEPRSTERLRARAKEWLSLLSEGAGFLRLRRFPTDQLSGDRLERAYIAFGRLFGLPVGQDRKGGLTTHIRDERMSPGPSIRRYQTREAQGFHSDASDYVSLLCLREAKSGGTSKIVSAHSIYNEMLAREPDLASALFQPMPWSRHTENRAGESAYFELAPFEMVDGTLRVSVIPWFIRQSQMHPAAPRLTDPQVAALDLLEALAEDQSFQIRMEFREGDIQVLNNTCILHSRDSYEDYSELDRRRHLLRLWLNADKPIADEVLRGTTNP